MFSYKNWISLNNNNNNNNKPRITETYFPEVPREKAKPLENHDISQACRESKVITGWSKRISEKNNQFCLPHWLSRDWIVYILYFNFRLKYSKECPARAYHLGRTTWCIDNAELNGKNDVLVGKWRMEINILKHKNE